MREKKHAIANVFHFVHVMRGPQHARPAGRRIIPDLNADFASDSGVERSRRFIQKK